MNDSKIEKSISEFIGDEKITSVEKGQKFLEWTLSYIFDKTDSEIEEHDIDEGVVLCTGANTIGINAGFRDSKGLHIIETRYGTSHSFDEVNNYINNIERLVINKDEDINKNTKKILNYINDESSIYFYYITNQKISDEYKTNIKLNRERVEKKLNINKDKTYSIIILDINTISNFVEQNTYSSTIPSKYKNRLC